MLVSTVLEVAKAGFQKLYTVQKWHELELTNLVQQALLHANNTGETYPYPASGGGRKSG